MDDLADDLTHREPRHSTHPTGSRHDPLLAVLQFLCTYHKRPFSSATALQGVAMPDDVLNVAMFDTAAGNVGLHTKIVNRKPSRVPALVFPFVLLFKNGEAGIALAKNPADGSINVQIPGSEPIDLTPQALDQETLHTVIYVSRSPDEQLYKPFSVQGSSGHWLWSVVGRFWSNWLNVVLAALFINLLGLALPLFVMNVYDRVIPNNSIATLWALSAGVLIALLFDFLLRMLRSTVIDNSGRRIDMKVSSLLFNQALDVKMAHRTGRAGDLASQIREFEIVRDFFTSASISSLIDLFFIGVFLAVLWLIVGPLVWVPMLAVPIVIVVTLFIQFPLSKSVALAQSTTANRHSILIESLIGIETVKAISAEGVLQGRWDEAVASSVRASSKIKFWSSLAIYFCMFVQQLVSVGIIVWGVFLVAENAITIGALIASNILAGRVLAPLGGIAMTLARAQQSFASLKQLNSLMQLERDHETYQRSEARVTGAALQIKGLKFAYPGQSHDALNVSTLNIAAGERVAIVGRIGSGKSTLGKLLCGLYQANAGALVLDGNEINQYSMSDLRQSVAYVGQEAELFTGSLQENILFTRSYDETRFNKVVSICGVAAFAQAHPHGYEMQVGERGKYLSGGQKQAVTLARAMMGSPKMLYLDEPTGGMDNLSEAALIRGFADWLEPGVSLVIATHRHSLLELVDRVIVLDNGKIIADGPREEIIKRLKNRKPVQKTGKKAGPNG